MYPQYLFEFPHIDQRFPFYMKQKRYHAVSAHRHDFIEFSLVLEGTGKEWINGKEHEMEPGTVTLLLPYQIHEYRATADSPLLMFICNFDMQLLTAGPELAWGLQELMPGGGREQSAYVQLRGEEALKNRRLWEQLYLEYESSHPWRLIVMRSLLLEMLAGYVRSTAKQTDIRKQPDFPASSQDIWPVVQYMHDHYLEPLSLAGLAGRFHMHPTQLSTQFSRTFGIFFVDFLHELRIRHACSLLITSDLPISQIAFEAGFSSYPTFSRTFRRIKGMTPRQYRERQTT